MAIKTKPLPDPKHIYSFGESYMNDALVSEAFGDDRMLAYRLVNFNNGKLPNCCLCTFRTPACCVAS